MSRFDTVRECESLEAFLAVPAPITGAWTIHVGRAPLDLLVEDRGAPTTIVFLSAALPAGDRRLPLFSGSGIAGDLKVNRIHISDPSLALDPHLRVAWYAGYEGVDLPDAIVQVVRHVQEAMGARHLALFGASAGGFAALSLGQLLGDVLSVAVNPQTSIERYNAKSWTDYIEACFGCEGTDAARATLRTKVRSAVDVTYSEGFPNTILYVQNARDAHMRVHLIPFARAVGAHDRLGYLIGSWGSGHVPPPKDVLRDILASAAAAEGNWSVVLDRTATHRNVDAAPLARLYGKPRSG